MLDRNIKVGASSQQPSNRVVVRIHAPVLQGLHLVMMRHDLILKFDQVRYCALMHFGSKSAHLVMMRL